MKSDKVKALSVRGLRKTYSQGRVEALRGIDLDVEQGDFFALLGPNGAGKSTLINMVTSLVKRDQGDIFIFGHNLRTRQELAKSCLGLVPQEINFNIFEPARQVLLQQAGYYGILPSEARDRIDWYLKRFELWDQRSTPVMRLSGGMKRRLLIIRALIHQPRLLILDEPTAGVDVSLRRDIWKFLRQINRAGSTIILTTHYLEEAESLCRNVAIIDHGRIVECGTVKDMLSRAAGQTFILDLKPGQQVEPIDGLDMKPGEAQGEIEMTLPRGQSLNPVFAALGDQGLEVMSMRNKSNRLEAFFLNLVQQNKKSAAKAPKKETASKKRNAS